MSYFSYDTFCKYLVLLEQSIDINQYCAGQVHIWPIYRSVLNSLLGNTSNPSLINDLPDKVRLTKIIDLINVRFDLITSGMSQSETSDLGLYPHPNHNINQKSSQEPAICVLSRTDDHTVKTRTGWYAPIIDSWYEIARSKCSILKAEILDERTTIDFTPRSIAPVLISTELSFIKLEDKLLFNDLKKQRRLSCERNCV